MGKNPMEKMSQAVPYDDERMLGKHDAFRKKSLIKSEEEGELTQQEKEVLEIYRTAERENRETNKEERDRIFDLIWGKDREKGDDDGGKRTLYGEGL